MRKKVEEKSVKIALKMNFEKWNICDFNQILNISIILFYTLLITNFKYIINVILYKILNIFIHIKKLYYKQF